MNIEIDTISYNDRRYGKPWIALVDFTSNAKGDFAWGQWVGDVGGEGLLILDAQPGDVIARGQKDTRKPRNSAPSWFIVEAAGTLRECSKVDAYKHARAVTK